MPRSSSVCLSTSCVYRHTVKRQREADLTSKSYAAIVTRTFAPFFTGKSTSGNG
jgi:hypothetical protein